MTKGPFSRHCERVEGLRGNLKRHFWTFSTAPRLRIYVTLFSSFIFVYIQLQPAFSSLHDLLLMNEAKNINVPNYYARYERTSIKGRNKYGVSGFTPSFF